VKWAIESGHVCKVQESGLATRDGATQDGMVAVAVIVFVEEITSGWWFSSRSR
jgi:hypothetical protein